MIELNSRLYEGWVRHRRFKPKHHEFRYPVFMSWLDLAELEQVIALSKLWSLEQFNLVSFFRKDYLGDFRQDLKTAVRLCIKAKTGEIFSGRICLLTHLRFFGFCFNPVSFYFCYPDKFDQPRFIVADINNTPWDERYCYVLDTRQSPVKNDKWAFEFDKDFHVSPFMPMQLSYRWIFCLHGPHLTIHMQLLRQGECCFDATLQLHERKLSSRAMRAIPLRYPFLSLSVLISIYWQALRLWLKGIPFFEHPDKKTLEKPR